jgi:hypothetical protein
MNAGHDAERSQVERHCIILESASPAECCNRYSGKWRPWDESGSPSSPCSCRSKSIKDALAGEITQVVDLAEGDMGE